MIKLRFSRKKAISKKAKEEKLQRSEHFKPGINQSNQSKVSDENSEDTYGSITNSNSITDKLLSLANEKDVPDWSELSFADKARLFNEWSLIIIIS